MSRAEEYDEGDDEDEEVDDQERHIHTSRMVGTSTCPYYLMLAGDSPQVVEDGDVGPQAA